MTNLSPTSLYITTGQDIKFDGYEYLGSYFNYDLDFDIKPYIKESIKKEVTVFDMDPEVCTHFYDYVDNRYCFMFGEGHSLQSLIQSNKISFDEDVKYNLYKKI